VSSPMARRLAAVIVTAVLATAGCGGSTESSPPTTTTTTTTSSAASVDIEGMVVVDYPGGLHVQASQRVAYDRTPPFGGAHDGVWAACNGVVYRTAVRNENMVHSLEHGAVWIAYDPARIAGDALAALERLVTGQPYLLLSPYPGLDRPLSLQSWGHQLKLDNADDPRLVQFVRGLRANPATHPEPGATCDAIPGVFDPANPPPFDPTPPGPDAVPVQ